MAFGYPVLLELAGQRAVVVGAFAMRVATYAASPISTAGTSKPDRSIRLQSGSRGTRRPSSRSAGAGSNALALARTRFDPDAVRRRFWRPLTAANL